MLAVVCEWRKESEGQWEQTHAELAAEWKNTLKAVGFFSPYDARA